VKTLRVDKRKGRAIRTRFEYSDALKTLSAISWTFTLKATLIPMRKILVVDDDPDIAEVIEQYFGGLKYDVCTMLEGEKVPETVSRIEPDLILLDLKLPDVYGMDVLKNLKKVGFQGPVVIITGNVSAGSAIEAMKEGAYEYLPKPFSLDELGRLVRRLLGEGEQSQGGPTVGEESSSGPETDQLVGRGSEILRIGKNIGQAASTEAPVLIAGERGTGKELIARIIHQNSKRKDKPFVVVDCAYTAPDILEDELFGRGEKEDKGDEHTGKLTLCRGGTLLLDGIESMGFSTQQRLLRTLSKGEVSPAEHQTVQANARIIATTPRQLSNSVSEGKFMQELFYFLRVISIFVPPLRDRRPDIPLLAEYFLHKYASKDRKAIEHVSSEAMKLLMSYSWPGNVEELENNMHSAVVVCKGDEILPDHLPVFYEGRVPARFDLQHGRADLSVLLRQTLDPVKSKLFQDLRGQVYDRVVGSVEKALINMALEQCGGNQVKSADLLGINRNTLRDRMLKFGLAEKEKTTHTRSSEY
jgi:DNA-binding NtrC family response regulator